MDCFVWKNFLFEVLEFSEFILKIFGQFCFVSSNKPRYLAVINQFFDFYWCKCNEVFTSIQFQQIASKFCRSALILITFAFVKINCCKLKSFQSFWSQRSFNRKQKKLNWRFHNSSISLFQWFTIFLRAKQTEKWKQTFERQKTCSCHDFLLYNSRLSLKESNEQVMKHSWWKNKKKSFVLFQIAVYIAAKIAVNIAAIWPFINSGKWFEFEWVI